MLTLLSDDPGQFPSVETALADPDGLLALGGDLRPERILHAYRRGIFPWFGDNDPILWWSPSIRCIVKTQDYQPNRSLKKLWRNHAYTTTFNQSFDEVIALCAESTASRPHTWITREMRQSYRDLHRLGHAHSVEVWQQEQLVGGLYGLQVGGAFCGESMFHRQSGASKVAFLALIQQMQQCGMPLLDCQLENPHLMSLGASLVSRKEFMTHLNLCTQLTSAAFV